MARYINDFSKRVQITDNNYKRHQYQSFMTAPEWRNVEMAEEFADFLSKNNSMFHYPYLKQVRGLWRIFSHSNSAARRYDSRYSVLTSEYMLMSLFVVWFTTVEFLFKAVFSLLPRMFIRRENDTAFQKEIAKYFKDYATRLQTIPFYNHAYHEDKKRIKEAYRSAKNKTWGDTFTYWYICFELGARSAVSSPLKYWFNQEGNVTPDVTDVLVKMHIENNQHNEHEAKKEFRSKLSGLSGVSVVDDQVFYKKPNKKNSKTNGTVYARIRAPRYKAFMNVVSELSNKEIKIRKIAAQDRVQVKFLIDHDSNEGVESEINRMCGSLSGSADLLYTYGDGLQPGRAFCLFDAPVRDLSKVIRLCESEKTKIEFIHNF